jgi:hypothetical protein
LECIKINTQMIIDVVNQVWLAHWWPFGHWPGYGSVTLCTLILTRVREKVSQLCPPEDGGMRSV